MADAKPPSARKRPAAAPTRADDRTLSIPALLGILDQVDPGSPFYAHAAAALDDQLVRNAPTFPDPTPRGPRRLLAIGMATYDDYDGVYFSVQAIRLYHPEVTDHTEIVVVDNHPTGACATALKDLEKHVAGYRYVPYERTQGTAVRDVVFREANADFVLCMDSHVFFRPGALGRLLSYLRAHPDSVDLWQGPLIGDDLKVSGTHFDPVWRGGMYGVWATDSRALDPDAPPFQIPMQGLGVFGCRRAAWPGFNPRLRGFGGEEGYIHEKIRRAGGRTLCLPFLGWMHRFNRPFGPRYTVSVDDRVRNYVLVHHELGLDASSALAHLEQEYGAETVRPIAARVERELSGALHRFEAIYCINLDGETGRWESVMRQCRALGLENRVRRFPAIDTPSDHRIGRALSHRAVVAEARWLGLDSVLVLEDDVLLLSRVAEVARHDLAGRDWDLLYLSDERVDPASVQMQAVAYHRSVYDRILEQIPATATGAARWLRLHRGIDHYYVRHFDGAEVLACPVPPESTSASPPDSRSTVTPHRASGFNISLLGMRVAVAGDSPAIAAVLDRYVLPWRPREAFAPKTADRTIEVRQRGDGPLAVLVDGAVAGSVPTPLAAIPLAQRALDEIVVRRQQEMAVVHCGVVAHGGRAILLLGPTRAGKSTLVAELVRRGAGYLSDEYAMIDAAGRVHPYPRPLLLRSRSGTYRPRLATDLGGAVVNEPIPAALVVQVTYAADAVFACQAVSQAEGLVLLLRNTPQMLAEQTWILANFERAIGSAGCYTGRRGEAREAAPAMLDLASSLRA